MADDALEILYFAPSDPARSPVVAQAQAFRAALAALDDVAVRTVLPAGVPEDLNGSAAGMAAVDAAVDAALRAEPPEGASRILHADVDRLSQREFWGLRRALQRQPDLPLCLTLRDPLHLPPPVAPTPPGPKAGFVERLLSSISGRLARFGQSGLGLSFLRRAVLVAVDSGTHGAQLIAHRPNLRTKTVLLPPMLLGNVLVREPEPSGTPHEKPLHLVVPTPIGCTDSAGRVLEALARLQQSSSLHRPVRTEIVVPAGAAAHVATVLLHKVRALGLEGGVEVRSEGPAGGRDLEKSLVNADIVVIPRANDYPAGAAAVFMQAQGSGAALLASEDAPFATALENGTDGILFDPDKPEALAEGLQRLVADDGFRTNLGQALRRKAAEERSPQRVATQMRRLYQEILTARDERRPIRTPADMALPESPESR